MSSRECLPFKCNVRHKKFLSLITIDRKSRSCLLYFITSVLLCYHTVTIIYPSKPAIHIIGNFMCKCNVRHNGIAPMDCYVSKCISITYVHINSLCHQVFSPVRIDLKEFRNAQRMLRGFTCFQIFFLGLIHSELTQMAGK